MTPLTETEMLVLRFMRGYQTVFGKPPTMSEILGWAPALHWRSSVRHVLLRLAEKGELEIIAPSNYSRRFAVVKQ